MARVVIRARRTAAERRTERNRIGPLRVARLAPATVRRYEKALQLFFHWLAVVHPSRMPTVGKLSDLVSACLEDLWDQGAPKGQAGDLLSALQWKLPQLRGRLYEGWDLFSTWSKTEVPTRAVPLPKLVLQAFVAHALRHHRPDVALMMWTSFEGLLRAAEFFKLTVADVQWHANTQQVTLTLRHTKGTQRAGGIESVSINDRLLVLILAAWTKHKQPGARLTELSYPALYAVLLDYVAHFQLHDFYIRPHSLRRGGATEFFQACGNLSLATVRGRWRSQATARLYIDTAMADSIVSSLPPRALKLLQSTAATLPHQVASW
eukprot:6477266-Amphidinium_carterae.1